MLNQKILLILVIINLLLICFISGCIKYHEQPNDIDIKMPPTYIIRPIPTVIMPTPIKVVTISINSEVDI